MKSDEFLETIRHHLESEVLEKTGDDVYSLSFDKNLTVQIRCLGPTTVRFEGIVTILPEDRFQSEQLLRKFLQRSLAQLHRESEILTLDSQDSVVWIYRELRTDCFNSPTTDAISVVEDFVNHLEGWTSASKDAPATIQPIHMLRP